MNTDYWWLDPNWRKNPCIVRSRNPLLKQAAMHERVISKALAKHRGRAGR